MVESTPDRRFGSKPPQDPQGGRGNLMDSPLVGRPALKSTFVGWVWTFGRKEVGSRFLANPLK